MRAAPHTYFPIVILDVNSDKIVAVGTLFIERKFLRGLGSVGHIEDIAVDKSQQGKKLGLRIIQALTHISESSGCYKTILNCSDANIRQYLALSFFFTLQRPGTLITSFSLLREMWLPEEGE
jgi:glucosamine-phosphate N-acetyltransferase